MFLVNVHKNFAIIYLMAIFNKKDTLTKTITFMALFAAINVVLSALTYITPFLSVVLVIFLPLTSTIVEVACKDKYYPIYAFGTIGLTFAVTFWNLDFAIFYIVPSIVTGYIFGLMIKKQISPMWSILTATVAQTGLSFAFIPLMELITERNLISDIRDIFHLGEWSEYTNFIALIFFTVSLIQIILSYIATYGELEKLGVTNENITKIPSKTWIFSGITGVFAILFFFIFKPISYALIGVSWYFAFFIVFKMAIDKRAKNLIICAAILVVNIFVFAIFYPMMWSGQILLLLFTPVLASLSDLLKL